MLYSEHYIEQATRANYQINQKFVIWVDTVEKIVYKKLRSNLIDLPDEDYMQYYENKMNPLEVAKYIIEQNSIYK